MSANQQPNPPEHVIAAAQRMLGAAWLSPQLRAAVEASVERMRAEQGER